jgi:UDP-N-acetylmuramoylalanine--D-glutamate ligase
VTAAVDASQPPASVESIDPATMDLDSFAGRRVAVLGLARSGVALCRFLADRGARVTAYDARPAEGLREAVEALGERAIALRLGPSVEPADVLAGQSLIATSPSISSRYPTTEPRLREALAQVEADGRVPVLSEVDLFLRLCPALTVGVTGTKGKTTTSSLTASVLSAGSEPVLLGGNIGVPLVERLPELTPRHRVVLELSELQLPTLSRGTDLAVYTHVTSDHLDRHGTLAAYRDVKRRLAELVPEHGALVLNAEDPVTAAYPAALPSRRRTLRYRRAEPGRGEVGVADGWIVAREVERLDTAGGAAGMTGPGDRIMPLADLALPGAHNVSNALAAISVGLLLGIAPDAMRRRVAGFTGVEHRLEPVALVDGVRFVNDSQGTQPDAVIAALHSFERPLVLIAGGRAKGLAIDELAVVVAERADAVVVIGETAPWFAAAFRAAGSRQVEEAPDLEAAVMTAEAIARDRLSAEPSATATVLLSPAAASFDMFEDYAARGRAFKSAVARSIAQRAGAGTG